MKRSYRRKRPYRADRILIILLSVFVFVCLALCGYYGYLILHKDQDAAEYRNEERETTPTEDPKMDDSSPVSEAILEKTDDAGREYIDETLFLGDSNTVRFMNYLDDDGYTFTSAANTIAVVGIGAEGITSVACEQLSWGTYTMADAVSLLQPRRIIMTFGTNNLDSFNMTADLFIESYESQILRIPIRMRISSSIQFRHALLFPIIRSSQLSRSGNTTMQF